MSQQATMLEIERRNCKGRVFVSSSYVIFVCLASWSSFVW